MEDYEKEALLYSFIEFSNIQQSSGPKQIIRPIIIKAIFGLNKKSFTPIEIYNSIFDEFSKKVDLLVIQSELGKLTSENKLIYDKKENVFKIVNVEFNYMDEYNKAARSTVLFIQAMKEFINQFSSKSNDLSGSKLFNHLHKFISIYLLEIVQVFSDKKIKIKDDEKSELHSLIETFIANTVIKNNEYYKSFENIYNGIMLLFIFEECGKIFEKSDYDFGEKSLFLDTNIILRILELQDSIQNLKGQELLKYFKDSKFSVSISTETWEETCGLIMGYASVHRKFIKGNNVSHIYQIMKNINIDPNNLTAFTNEIKSKLSDIGIQVVPIDNTNENEFYDIENESEELAKIKYENRNDFNSTEEFNAKDFNNYYRVKAAKYDLKNVRNIFKMRNGKASHTFEKEKYYFITADYQLRKFVREKYKFNGQPVVLSDSTLAFLLFYKDPNNSRGFGANSFVNAHFNSKRLSILNWYSYYNAVKNKFHNKELSKSQIGYLLTRVVLDNEKIHNHEIDELIEESIDEFKKIESKNNEELNNKNTLISNSEFEAEKLKNIIEQMQNDSEDTIGRVVDLESQLKIEHNEKELIRNKISLQDKTIRNSKIELTVIKIFLICVSLVLFLQNNAIFGTLIGLSSGILFIYDLYRKRD